MATEDPWDAPDPAKLRITASPTTRPLPRPPVHERRGPTAPPPHHASPRPEHGVIDEAAVEAPPIPRPEQPQAPKPAIIDTRVSQGQAPVPMVGGFDDANWRDVDGTLPKPPPVRPWARNAGITLGVIASLVILIAIGSVLVTGLFRAIQDPAEPSADEPMPGAEARVEPKAFPDPVETSIVDEDEVPVYVEEPPEENPYGEEEEGSEQRL
ncbi:MAG: hypothetical protein AAGA48_02210 [Myxococcota bacterium]